MKYYDLRSVIASRKVHIALEKPTASFFAVSEREHPYIEPTFTKDDFPTEKPSIILVSAIGASGKTTTARALAHDIDLPILDLAEHKPVGDNTLTGLLTSTYPVAKAGEVLEGLRSSTHGIIIDGLDEGRSKTSEGAFEAFLDDLIQRSQGSPGTSIVIFGRSQALLSAWIYLSENEANVGLIRIDPFGLEDAVAYVDAYVDDIAIGQEESYQAARDGILDQLGAAFSAEERKDEAFLSFIGYPPVLDAIATLLAKERNYHRISQAFGSSAGSGLEIDLLIRITDLLMSREREEKALPNFINEIADKATETEALEMRGKLYAPTEQCGRVLAAALRRDFPVAVVEDPALSEEYESALETWCPEHPFLDGERIRNPVFEAVALAYCATNEEPKYVDLALEYAANGRPTYHFPYILEKLIGEGRVDARLFNLLIQSCSDFVGRGRSIEIEVNGVAWDDPGLEDGLDVLLEVTITGAEEGREKTMTFVGSVGCADELPIGPFLVNSTITVPCQLRLIGVPALDCFGVCRVSAKRVEFETDLVVRGAGRHISGGSEREDGFFVDAGFVGGHAGSVIAKGCTVEIGCDDHSLSYPLAKYVIKRVAPTLDSEAMEKFRRLRRILQEFRSHSKGGLAKYRDKIEHERVLRGKLGKSVLKHLLDEEVLCADPKFYRVNSEKFSEVLETTWREIRNYKVSSAVAAFLARVPST